MAIITIHMRKNDGLGKKNSFSHLGGSVSLPGVRELGCISGRLPDDLGGFTCMSCKRKFLLFENHHRAIELRHEKTCLWEFATC